MRRKSGCVNHHQRRSDPSTGILARFHLRLAEPFHVFNKFLDLDYVIRRALGWCILDSGKQIRESGIDSGGCNSPTEQDLKGVAPPSSGACRERANLRQAALIIKFGQIGDVIMVLPAVYELHRQGFSVDWVCGKAVRPLLECYTWVNVLPAEDGEIFFGKPLERIRSVAHVWRQIITRTYDLCATLYYDRRFRLLSLPVRAKRKFFLSRGSRTSALLPGRRQPDEFMRTLLLLDDGCREGSAALVPPDRLPPSPLRPRCASRRVAVVAGGTRNIVGEQPLRRWPIEYYEQVIDQLLARKWEVVLLGGPDDTWVSEHFRSRSLTDCISRLTLPEVVSACNDCDAVISHDTGPLHLAGLSRSCLVGIYGPTDPSTFFPRRSNAVAIWGGQGFACRPCYDGRDFAPCTFNGCMHQVTPDLVLRELDRVLAEFQAGEPSPWRIVFPEPKVAPSSTAVRLVSLGTPGGPEAESTVGGSKP